MPVAIAIALVFLSSVYAAILNIKRVHNWYTPDRTYITVVIGNSLILAGLLCLVPAGMLSFWQWWHALIYTVSAGVPIIIWQRIRAIKRRRRAAQALERK